MAWNEDPRSSIDFRSPAYKAQAFISITGWLTIFCASALLLWMLTRGYLMLQMQASLMRKMLDTSTAAYQDFSQTSKTWYLMGGLVLVVVVLYLLAAILLLQRRHFGRILFTLVSIALVVGLLITLGYYRSAIQSSLPPWSSLFPNRDESLGDYFGPLLLAQFIANGLLLLAGLWLLVRLLIKLNSQTIRALFR